MGLNLLGSAQELCSILQRQSCGGFAQRLVWDSWACGPLTAIRGGMGARAWFLLHARQATQGHPRKDLILPKCCSNVTLPGTEWAAGSVIPMPGSWAVLACHLASQWRAAACPRPRGTLCQAC